MRGPTIIMTLWHRLAHESGKRVWARNVRIVSNTCLDRACPGKPYLLQGYIKGYCLWYSPSDVQQTVHVVKGEHLYSVEGMGACTACQRRH